MPHDRDTADEPNLPTGTFDPRLDAGLAAAFGSDPTPGGWSQPPFLRDDDSDPIVHPNSAEMPQVGNDRYQLLGEIAHGGMGVVLKGRDPDLGRDLAFKVLKSELVDRPTAVERFVEEAQIAGQLQHPGVVPVYDLGRFTDGRPYFAMKLVRGHTLADQLTERKNPADDRGRFLRVLLQVCETIAYAHDKGVVHRDLKPSNVMVGAYGEVLVLDWGLSKVLSRGGVADERRADESRNPPGAEPTSEIRTVRFGSGSETVAGSVFGTPAFMPPEQAGGEVDKLDERADVFGLGAILCVLLTGQPPYVGKTADEVRLMAVRGALAGCFARLDGCAADTELLALAKRCLATERSGRPRNAKEVADALSAYLTGIEERARRAELERAAAEAESREQRKRRRVQLALTAALALLFCGGGAFAWWQDRQSAARRNETENRERDERERLARNADAVAVLLNRCEDALRTGNVTTAELALEQARKRADEGGSAALADRLEQRRADLKVSRELDAINQFRWLLSERGYPLPSAAVAKLKAALSEFGLRPGAESPEVSAARVTRSAVRDRLVDALDRWLSVERVPTVRTVLRLADPNPFRDAVRDAALAGNDWEVTQLSQRDEAQNQPTWFLAQLGERSSVSLARRRALLRAGLAQQPADLTLLLAMGETFQAHGQVELGSRWFQAAVAVAPHNMAAHFLLGLSLSESKPRDLDGAAAAFKEVVRLEPKSVRGHVRLAYALRDNGNLEEAAAAFKELVRLEPSASNFLGLGEALTARGDADGAIAALAEAVRLGPQISHTHYVLGTAHQARGDLSAAVAAFRESVRLDPKYTVARYHLALLLATGPDGVRDGNLAVEHATRACELSDWKHPPFIDALAAACAEAGEFDKAVEYQKRALSFPEFERRFGADRRKRLELYAQRKPYRDPALAPREVAPPRARRNGSLMTPPEITCWTLIRAAAAGDMVARERFARVYLPVIRAYLAARWRRAPRPSDPDDAAQDVFVECFRNGGLLEKVDPTREGGFRAFLLGAVRNVARRNETRRTAAELPAEFPGDDTGPAEAFDRAWARAILEEAGRCHEERPGARARALRRVRLLRLRFGEGRPIRDIARAWGADAAELHHEYATAREEFRAALRETVAFHTPGATADEIDRTCGALLDLLAG